MDKPIVSGENVEVLQRAWDAFHNETDSWGHWTIKDLQEEMISKGNL